MGEYFSLKQDIQWVHGLADQLRGPQAVWPVQCGDGSDLFSLMLTGIGKCPMTWGYWTSPYSSHYRPYT